MAPAVGYQSKKIKSPGRGDRTTGLKPQIAAMEIRNSGNKIDMTIPLTDSFAEFAILSVSR